MEPKRKLHTPSLGFRVRPSSVEVFGASGVSGFRFRAKGFQGLGLWGVQGLRLLALACRAEGVDESVLGFGAYGLQHKVNKSNK